MRYVMTSLWGVAVVVGLCWHATAEATTLFSIDISRTSADREAQTFSGSGLIHFESPANDVADIDFFSLEIQTIGSRFADPDLVEVPRRFVFGLTDILSVDDLAAGPALSGVILLGSKVSQDGDVALGEGTRLDFTAGLASGFCFAVVGDESCIFGGGSSTGIEAGLGSAIVPLPWASPLLVIALGVLALVARPGDRRPMGPA
jgi:hypothetical protein